VHHTTECKVERGRRREEKKRSATLSMVLDERKAKCGRRGQERQQPHYDGRRSTAAAEDFLLHWFALFVFVFPVSCVFMYRVFFLSCVCSALCALCAL
jgi:hypothetical protein